LSIAPEKIAELRVKHLEMAQAVVARLANQGATLKNYCVTVTTAACGFAVTSQHAIFALLALIPIITFAALDTKYLHAERRFRAVFNQIRAEDWGTLPSFEFDHKNVSVASYWTAFRSWSVLGFYAPLALGVAIVVIILGVAYGRFV
jgi:uncharacterized membrane protein